MYSASTLGPTSSRAGWHEPSVFELAQNNNMSCSGLVDWLTHTATTAHIPFYLHKRHPAVRCLNTAVAA